jgi:hypothetical protein
MMKVWQAADKAAGMEDTLPLEAITGRVAAAPNGCTLYSFGTGT